MHTTIPSVGNLIDELNHPTVTPAAILAAFDMPVEDLNLDVSSLDLPDEALGDLDGPFDVAVPAGTASPPRGKRSTLATAPVSTGTTHTTIRIPAKVLAAYKARAAQLGIGYQTLIVRTLAAKMRAGLW